MKMTRNNILSIGRLRKSDIHAPVSLLVLTAFLQLQLVPYASAEQAPPPNNLLQILRGLQERQEKTEERLTAAMEQMRLQMLAMQAQANGIKLETAKNDAQAALDRFSNLPVTDPKVATAKQELEAAMAKLQTIDKDTPKEEVDQIMKEVEEKVRALQKVGDEHNREFSNAGKRIEQAANASGKENPLKFDRDCFAKHVSFPLGMVEGIKKLDPPVSAPPQNPFTMVSSAQSTAGIGASLLAAKKEKEYEKMLTWSKDQLLAKIETYSNRGYWSSDLVAAYPEAAENCLREKGASEEDIKKFVHHAKGKHQARDTARNGHEAMTGLLMGAMMTGNPYIIGAAFILAILMMIFGGGSGDGDGDGDGSGDGKYDGDGSGTGSPYAGPTSEADPNTGTVDVVAPPNPEQDTEIVDPKPFEKTDCEGCTLKPPHGNIKVTGSYPGEVTFTLATKVFKYDFAGKKEVRVAGTDDTMLPLGDELKLDSVDFEKERLNITVDGEEYFLDNLEGIVATKK